MLGAAGLAAMAHQQITSKSEVEDWKGGGAAQDGP